MPPAVLAIVFGLIGTVQRQMHPQPVHETIKSDGETFTVDTTNSLREVVIRHTPSGNERQNLGAELRKVREEIAAIAPSANSAWPEGHPDAKRKAAAKKAAVSQLKALRKRDAEICAALQEIEGATEYRIDFYKAAKDGRFSVGMSPSEAAAFAELVTEKVGLGEALARERRKASKAGADLAVKAARLAEASERRDFFSAQADRLAGELKAKDDQILALEQQVATLKKAGKGKQAQEQPSASESAPAGEGADVTGEDAK